VVLVNYQFVLAYLGDELGEAAQLRCFSSGT